MARVDRPVSMPHRGQRVAGRRRAGRPQARAHGLTQVELARRMRISQSDLSKLERRSDVRLSTLHAYAEALGGKIWIAPIMLAARGRQRLRWLVLRRTSGVAPIMLGARGRHRLRSSVLRGTAGECDAGSGGDRTGSWGAGIDRAGGSRTSFRGTGSNRTRGDRTAGSPDRGHALASAKAHRWRKSTSRPWRPRCPARFR